MRVSEFGRDLATAPSSEDQVVVLVDGISYEVAAVDFVEGQVRIFTGERDAAPVPVALAEQTAQDQQDFGAQGGTPGHADVMNQKATGAGIASDVRGEPAAAPVEVAPWGRGQGQAHSAGPEQLRPATAPVQDDRVAEDSGT